MERQILSFPIIFTFLLFLFTAIRIWKKTKTNNSTQKLPPGPWKLPLVGSMHHLVGSLPHHRLSDLAKKYGPLMHLQLGEVTNIVVSSPEIAYGDYWRQLRKICTLELLTAKRVESFRSIREEEVSKLIRSISSNAGSPINFSRMFNSLTYSITSKAAFGKIWKGEEIFIPTVKKLIESAGGFSLADLYPSIKFLQVISTMRPKLERLHQEVDKIFQNIIEDHRARKAAAKSGTEIEEDFVDVLLNLQDKGDLEFPLTTPSGLFPLQLASA